MNARKITRTEFSNDLTGLAQGDTIELNRGHSAVVKSITYDGIYGRYHIETVQLSQSHENAVVYHEYDGTSEMLSRGVLHPICGWGILKNDVKDLKFVQKHLIQPEVAA